MSLATRASRLVRHYSPSEAQERFGSGSLDGVIEVLTSSDGS